MRSLPINGKVPTLDQFSLLHFLIAPKVNTRVIIISAGHRTKILLKNIKNNQNGNKSQSYDSPCIVQSLVTVKLEIRKI